MKIAFVGHPSSGKDVASEYTAKKFSLHHISSSDLIREYIKKNNLGEIDRKNMQKVANDLRAKNGSDYLVRLAFKNAPDNLVLSGLRAIGEIETFKKNGGMVLAVNAPVELRYKLAQKRGRVGENISFEEFRMIEESENESKDTNGQNVNKVISMADIVIDNDKTLEDLFMNCEKAVSELYK